MTYPLRLRASAFNFFLVLFFLPISLFAQKKPAAKMETMPVNEAVMVTVELDFGKPVPTIAQALTEIERKYKPKDGTGRTFAIIEAYGEPTADGKLHISMHISTEKTGTGSLVFKRTGEILWQSKITANPNKPETTDPKGLTIYIDYDGKRSLTVDGSSNPASIFDAKLKENGALVNDFWKEGREKEVQFVYSTCGCPVHIKAKRFGNKSVRSSELPVLFPDDPAAVAIINRLMRW